MVNMGVSSKEAHQILYKYKNSDELSYFLSAKSANESYSYGTSSQYSFPCLWKRADLQHELGIGNLLSNTWKQKSKSINGENGFTTYDSFDCKYDSMVEVCKLVGSLLGFDDILL